MRVTGFLLVILIMLVGCKPESGFDKYKKQAKQEMASNKRADSIFFGIYLGMPGKDFFTHCWNMNKKGIFTDGTDGKGNMYILYKLPKELKYPAAMNFYPAFEDSVIKSMRVFYQYEGWVPWNKSLSADSLLPHVVSMYKKWYPGNDFIEMNDKIKGPLYAKVDGNRRITIAKSDDVQVKVEFTDMLVENKMKDKHAVQ
jgi:hypothetical protein